MRLFKVYNGDESDHELVFAKNHRQAASIAQTVWDENDYRCRRFKVVMSQWAWSTNRQPPESVSLATGVSRTEIQR